MNSIAPSETWREVVPAQTSQIDGLPDARVVVARALAAALRPRARLTVSAWAEKAPRIVAAESGSPFPGEWRNDRMPHLVEIMDCLSLSHPCRSVTFRKSAQVGGSEGGLNLIGAIMDHEPAPILVVLPSLDEAKKYVKGKLDPMIEATPRLKRVVKEKKSRDEDGSTTAFKKFRGGYCVVTGANSSKGLQMISARVILLEEVSEYPFDVDGRGDPADMAEARTKAWSARKKVFWNSTPGIKGSCRIDQKWQVSDQRRRYVPCPQCGVFHTLKPEALRSDLIGELRTAWFVCPANGCVIEEHHKPAMLAAGQWVKTFPAREDATDQAPPDWFEPEELGRWLARSSGGREPGFALWQVYNPQVSWADTAKEIAEAEGNPHKEKIISQQVLGEPYEEKGEAPDYVELAKRVEDYPLGQIPPGGLVLTGMADIQKDRIEYGVYAWGRGMTGWLIDKGVIIGDPHSDPGTAPVWKALAEVVGKKYQDHKGCSWPIEAFGIDTGYLSHHAYMFARGRPRVFALDGRPGHLLPMMGTPRAVDIRWDGRQIRNGVKIWPTGTYQLKAWVYAALRLTIAGPDDAGAWPSGVLHFPVGCDEHWFAQLTAEHLTEHVHKSGRVERVWTKIQGRPNEALDITVGARALAYHLGLDMLLDEGWRRIEAERAAATPVSAQPDLADLWAPRPGTERLAPALTTPQPKVIDAPAKDVVPPPVADGARRVVARIA
jgi:phage terminase large subunit GpA-like protein